jgi:hypothetical protein
MADALKLLYTTSANRNPGAATLTALYTVPVSTTAMVSRIMVANRSATPTSFRIALLPNGVAVGGVLSEHYIAFDVPIGGNDTAEVPVGGGLEAGVTVAVLATLATLTFNIFGIEVS